MKHNFKGWEEVLDEKGRKWSRSVNEKALKYWMGCERGGETIYQSLSQCTVCLICGMPVSQ